MDIHSITLKFKGFINESKRVLRVTKKPDKAEFITIVKASALGMAAIGLIGFIIQMVNILFFK
ncbi:protein translocase SEC61 complex subunit gamma [Candidatus Woesearchaeota archaeon]|nr:protein translocase SEC61 complex subunit gamma [Candidatus Woesearchaeota archaeon]